MDILHRPVLMTEVIKNLITKSDGIYVDATYGRGGHSQGILEVLNEHGRLIALDKDDEAIVDAKQRFSHDKRFEIHHCSFSNLSNLISSLNLTGKISGILLDAGVSSPQLDQAERGFSFNKDATLDMRMDRRQTLDARSWINTTPARTLCDVLKDFGEEKYAKRIANAIVMARAVAPIDTTKQLANIVAEAHPSWEIGQHPATKTFQAIRIFVNQELDELRSCLKQSLTVLAPQGRLAVISFHSLEDRIVKQFIRMQSRGEILPKEIPLSHNPNFVPQLKKIGRKIKPSVNEIKENPRARSAVMRIAEKLQ